MKRFTLAVIAVLCGAAPVPALVQPTQVFDGSFSLISSRRNDFPPVDSIIALPAHDCPVYGMYAFGSEYRTFRTGARQLNMGHIRTNGSFGDADMTALAQDGYRVMTCLMTTRRGECASDEAFINEFLAALRTHLGKYGPGGSFFTANPSVPDRPVESVEIWNEPNIHFMWPEGTEAQREALYAKLLVQSYAAVKESWPTVRVAAFGTSGSSAGDLRFIENVHALDSMVAHSYDLVTTHPYNHPAPTEATYLGTALGPNLKTIRNTMARYGAAGKPVGYTEIGWGVSEADGSHSIPSTSPTVSVRMQAAYVLRTYAIAMRLGLEFVDIMYIVDIPNYNAGFFKRDHSWREQAYGTQTMTTLMPFPKLAGAPNDGNSYWHVYDFIADVNAASPETVQMAWDIKAPRTVDFEVKNGRAVVYDMLGDSTVYAEDGEIEIGPCPVFIKSGTIVSPYASVAGADKAAAADAVRLTLGPVPVSGATVLGFTLAEAGNVTLAAYAADGSAGTELVNRAFVAGSHSVNVGHAVSGLEAGLYLYSFTAGNSTRTGTFIVAE